MELLWDASELPRPWQSSMLSARGVPTTPLSCLFISSIGQRLVPSFSPLPTLLWGLKGVLGMSTSLESVISTWLS